MAEIGSQWILKGTLSDGTVVYWNKTQEYVKDPAHATFCKIKSRQKRTRRPGKIGGTLQKVLLQIILTNLL